MAPPGDRISLNEAAERLGVHYMTMYRYVRTGRLPAVRDGVQWTVDVRDVDRLRAPAAPPARRGSNRIRQEGPGKLVARMVAGDEAGAWGIVDAALAAGLEAGDVSIDLLVPALRSVGDGWSTGVLSVADEHRAAAVAQRLIGRLGPRFARRGRKRGTVVLGAPAGENHSLPCAIVADLLRGAGFEVIDMGANTPAESFVDSARHANRLTAVLIGATTPHRDAAIRSTVRALRAGGITAPVIVGGAGIVDADHARSLGADAWSGHDGRSVVAAVETAADSRPGTARH